MACINFNSSKKNNKWREVKLDPQKEQSIMKFFGVDTETNVTELLQHNLTLFDWIRKNQGFPYFVGRRINGENALTKDELTYINDNGSKAIPLFKPFDEMCGKDNAKMAIAILEELELEKGISVYVELDANIVTDEFLKDFANKIIVEGYVPGFYVDTDSYYNFDRQYSRAYQSDEMLMKQCKIWATAPEMDEFFETQNSHNEKPDFWGPFAPSCITKEQISFWQYGKKAHPINTYSGKRTDFNLNLTIEPYNIFDVKNVDVVSFDIEKADTCKLNACIKSDRALETISLECNFERAKSQSTLSDNKLYASNIVSSHKILEFVICENNDVLSSKHIVTEGNALVKLAFVSNEKSCVYYLRLIVSLAEYDTLKKVLDEAMLIEEVSEIQKLSNQEMWATKFFKENFVDASKRDDTNNENTSIKNYIYKPKGDISETEIISPMLMRTTISGDTYNIFETIPQAAVKRVGSECCTVKDVDGSLAAAYYKYTSYEFDYYYTRISIWNLYDTIHNTADGNNDRVVEFEYKQAYNAFIKYYPSENRIEVFNSDDNYTYFPTFNTQISLNLTGCQTAYISAATFEACMGGTEEVGYMDSILAVLGFVASETSILGKMLKMISFASDVYTVLSDSIDVLRNYVFNPNNHQYNFYPNCGLVTKHVGRVFKPTLYKKNSSLKIRAIVDNITIYPTSRVSFQIRTTVDLGFGLGEETICMQGSRPLQ